MLYSKIPRSLLFFFFTFLGYSQSTQYYFEDFTGEDEKGIQFSGTDTSGVNWLVDTVGSGAVFDGGSDHIKVERRSGEDAIEVRDPDALVSWFTPVIDVSAGTNHYYYLFADVSEQGSLESNDSVILEYQINQNGIWLVFETNGSLNDDFTSAQASQFLASDTITELQIRISAENNANNERIRWDNVEIIGLDLGDADILDNFAVTSCIWWGRFKLGSTENLHSR